MSHKRRRRQSRGPTVALLLLIALVVAGLAFSRLYPRYLRPRPHRVRGAPAARPVIHPTSTAASSQPRVRAQLYFARVVGGEERLVALPRDLPREAPARAALQELIGGEVPPGCQRPLPTGTTIGGLRVENGLATVDFSRELISNFEGGSDHEGVVVYAIVNTLASLPGVTRVQILVEGKPVDSIGGHLDLSGSLEPDGELVVKR